MGDDWTHDEMTKGWTNRTAGGDHAIQDHTYAADAIGPVLGVAAAITAVADPNMSPNVCPNISPNTDPNAVDPNTDSWRVEVAARVQRYRTRRKPRTPRYPSLLLPFDAPETWFHPAPSTDSTGAGSAGTGSAAIAAARPSQDFAFDTDEEPAAAGAAILAEPCPTQERQTLERHISERGPGQYPEPALEPSAKVIEFPRCAAIPVFRRSELADPVFDHDRPRIVEAPEILPPPPALGGITIEPAHQEPADKRVNFPAAFPSASIARRALAAFVDGVILAMALAGFAAIVLRLNPSLNPVRGPLPMLAGALGLIAVLLWAVYEFLFVVYTGSTPGLRAARLRLAAFDGSPLHRRVRCWRVLASFLCAFSAGLGYLWCVLDQDGLCWHDRITRTYVQAERRAEQEKPRPSNDQGVSITKLD